MFSPFKAMSGLGIGFDESIDSPADRSWRGGTKILKRLLPEDAEPALNLVQPGSMCGCIVEMDVGMPGQPPVMLGFVDIEVVQDDVQLRVRIVGQNMIREIEELPAAPARVVSNLYQADGHLLRGQQGCSAMTLILLSKASQGLAIRQAQLSLGTFQGLESWFLIDAEHKSILWRIQVESHNMRRFSSKLRVGADTPPATTLQMYSPSTRYSPDMVGGHIAQSLAQKSSRPCGVASRRRSVQLSQNTLLGYQIVFGSLTWTERVYQPCPAHIRKPDAPYANCGSAQPQILRNLLCLFPRRAFQHDTGPLHHALLHSPFPHPGLRFYAFLFSQIYICCYSRHAQGITYNDVYCN